MHFGGMKIGWGCYETQKLARPIYYDFPVLKGAVSGLGQRCRSNLRSGLSTKDVNFYAAMLREPRNIGNVRQDMCVFQQDEACVMKHLSHLLALLPRPFVFKRRKS